MKRLFAVFIAAGLLGCQQEEPEFVEVNLEDKEHKLSYALGLNLSDNLKKQLDMPIDVDVFVQGFKDGYTGESPLFSFDEALKILMETEEEQRAQQLAEKNKMAAENKKSGETFLAENMKKEGVVTLDSGLQYKVIKAGDGQKPQKTDAVVCHYRGTLLDGTEFDSSYSRGEPAQFRVDQLIPGWTEALQLMPAGSKWELYIPSYLAYGARQAGQISPNSTLIFELELLEIK
ncbi:MAG: FKBP-type peptidyl-prolyl cis-trans isomerase [Candidatus Latescibacteria bacterium]|nr:FKBP-type peptidyl-prolyl cis-trans isomerase [Candidatus Latescibacterota bacterium]